MKPIVGFGELMLRLGPKGYLRFRQAREFEINYTGAEANVCVSLAMLGMPSRFVTRLPKNAIADSAVAMLRSYGVDTSYVIYGGDRIGVYYVEKGAAQRPSEVIYDRKNTSIAQVGHTDFNWHEILKDAGGLHITGVTPALSPSLAESCVDACRVARELDLVVSCDLNFRKKLWTSEQAKPVMEQILSYVDLCIANEEDCDKVLGIKAADTNVEQGRLNREGYGQVAHELCARYGVKAVGITLRESLSASDNNWSAMFYTGGEAYFSKKYPIHIVDRVGGGDSFAAGLIYATTNDFTPQCTAEFAAAASCLKHSIEMDFNLTSLEEVYRLMNGDGSGRVQR